MGEEKAKQQSGECHGGGAQQNLQRIEASAVFVIFFRFLCSLSARTKCPK